MAKKISKGVKRVMSIIFHLAVLVVMVNLYDTARAMLSGKHEGRAIHKDIKKDGKSGSAPKSDKTTDKPKPAGTSMEELMAAKQKKDKEKAEKTAQENKEEK